MRSMNVKRVAAIATGAAMVGSVFAISAFGAVQTQGDVSGLVTSIKSNLNDVQVVIGTNGAAIIDGVQAAKIAATLANENYAPAGAVTGASVDVQTTSAGGGISITPSVYTMELAQNATAVSQSNGYITNFGSAILTPIQLGDVLGKKNLAAYISGSVQNFNYQEEIALTGARFVQYHEAGPNPTGHGLYFNAPYGSLTYKLNFQASGQGIPTNGSAFNEVPSITVLGNNYALDTTELTNGRLVLYSGAKQEILEGESVTVGTATITVTGVGQITSSSGTSFTAIVRAEKGGTSQTQTIQRLSGFDFFASQGESSIVTVYLEEIIYGASGGSKVIARVGSNKIRFNVGQQFALDSQWTVDAVDITGNAASNGLRSVTLKYGKPTGTTPLMRGIFDGTVSNGLAQGITVPGPTSSGGQSLWSLKLVGLGGATQTDATSVSFTGVGQNTSSSTTSALQAIWTDRDGIVNEWMPTDRTFANVSGGGANLGLTLGTVPYTIANDKVLWLSEIKTVTSGTNTQYTPVFKIGGANGFELSGTTASSASAPTQGAPLNSTLAYTGGISGNTLNCPVSITSTSTVMIGTNGTSCDLVPDSIPVGTKTVFDRAATNAPLLNMNFSGSGSGASINPTLLVDGANPRAAAYLTETTTAGAAGKTLVVWYDDTSSAGGNTSSNGAGTTTGLQVYNATTINPTYYHTYNATMGGVYVDQSKTSVYEPDLYHVTQSGTWLDGSLNGKLTAILYEAAPSAILQIGAIGTSSNASTGTTQTVNVGGSVGGVKIVAVNVGGNAYVAQTAVDPASLVALDTGATKTYKIVVGGPYVNRIAAGMSAANLITQAGAQYLVAEGNNLMVAGYLGTDTAAAADSLISLLKA